MNTDTSAKRSDLPWNPPKGGMAVVLCTAVGSTGSRASGRSLTKSFWRIARKVRKHYEHALAQELPQEFRAIVERHHREIVETLAQIVSLQETAAVTPIIVCTRYQPVLEKLPE